MRRPRQATGTLVLLLVMLMSFHPAWGDSPKPVRGFYLGAGIRLATLGGELNRGLTIENGTTARAIRTIPLFGSGIAVGVRGDWWALEGALMMSPETWNDESYGFDYLVASLDGKLLVLGQSRMQPFCLLGIASSELEIHDMPMWASASIDGLANRMGVGTNLFMTHRLFLTLQTVYMWTPPSPAEGLLSAAGPVDKLAIRSFETSLVLHYTVTGMGDDPNRVRLRKGRR